MEKPHYLEYDLNMENRDVFQPGMTAVRKSTGEAVVIIGFDKCIGSFRMWKIQSLVSGRFNSCLENDLMHSALDLQLSEAFKNWEFKDYFAFRQAMTHIRVKGELTNIFYSMGFGDVEFKPHQFKPVMKFITENRGRLLIADEVGLGKTIEALYIWKELQVRENARRLLVVCPASLVDKWQMDMKRLFSMNPQQVGAKEFRTLCYDLSTDRQKPCCIVTSIEGIRSKEREDKSSGRMTAKDEVFDFLKRRSSSYNGDSSLFDLVIVDEAHNVRNSSTCNYKTVEALIGNSNNTVFLSATPIQTSSDNLFNLLRLLAPEEFSNIGEFNNILKENEHLVSLAGIFNRRHQKGKELDESVKNARHEIDQISRSRYFRNSGIEERIGDALPQLLTDDEQRVSTFSFITNKYFYSSIVSRTRKKDIPGEHPVRTPQTVNFTFSETERAVYDRITTSLRNSELEGKPKTHEFVVMMRQREMASSLPAALEKWRKAERNADEISMLYEESYGTGDDLEDGFEEYEPPAESVTSEELSVLQCRDSKYDRFLNEVIRKKISENVSEKIVVFSFFKATLAYLERRLCRDGVSVLRMDGSIDDRTSVIRRFRDGNFSVLLSSEVGSEGIDLQFASVIVNYDLPWNPMRLEQRIGRIDRIGQKSKFIFIVNMACNNTVEDKILLRLYDRIEIFKRSIGETDEILGKLTTEIQEILLRPELTDDQRIRLADEAINGEIKDRQLQEQLEEKAGITEAYGESIMRYVAESSDNNRFIRREDLISYIEDYFRSKGKGSTISRCKGPKGKDKDEFRLIRLSDEAFDDFHQYTIKKRWPSDPGFRAGKVCCFPQGKTQIGYEGIDINHPLIRWIFDRNEQEIGHAGANCFALTVSLDKLENKSYQKGTYVFFVKEIHFEGIRIRRELFHVVMKVNAPSPLSPVQGEYLLSQALFHGAPMTNLSDYRKYSSRLNVIMQTCLDVTDTLIDKASAEFLQDEDSTYNIQLNRIEKIHATQTEAIQSIIDNYDRSSPQFGNVKRLQEGRLNKLDNEYRTARLSLEKKKESLKVSSEELAVGIISVV